MIVCCSNSDRSPTIACRLLPAYISLLVRCQSLIEMSITTWARKNKQSIEIPECCNPSRAKVFHGTYQIWVGLVPPLWNAITSKIIKVYHKSQVRSQGTAQRATMACTKPSNTGSSKSRVSCSITALSIERVGQCHNSKSEYQATHQFISIHSLICFYSAWLAVSTLSKTLVNWDPLKLKRISENVWIHQPALHAVVKPPWWQVLERRHWDPWLAGFAGGSTIGTLGLWPCRRHIEVMITTCRAANCWALVISFHSCRLNRKDDCEPNHFV